MKNLTDRDLAIFAVLAVIASLTWILASTYMQQATAQNQSGSSSGTINNNKSPSPGTSTNWTGSIQISPILSQTIQSKVHNSLSDAASIAEKAVGTGSHASSARLVVERGFLVYSVLVRDTNNNVHIVIVDPGNGRLLANEQPFMMSHYYNGISCAGVRGHPGFITAGKRIVHA